MTAIYRVSIDLFQLLVSKNQRLFSKLDFTLTLGYIKHTWSKSGLFFMIEKRQYPKT